MIRRMRPLSLLLLFVVPTIWQTRSVLGSSTSSSSDVDRAVDATNAKPFMNSGTRDDNRNDNKNGLIFPKVTNRYVCSTVHFVNATGGKAQEETNSFFAESWKTSKSTHTFLFVRMLSCYDDGLYLCIHTHVPFFVLFPFVFC